MFATKFEDIRRCNAKKMAVLKQPESRREHLTLTNGLGSAQVSRFEHGIRWIQFWRSKSLSHVPGTNLVSGSVIPFALMKNANYNRSSSIVVDSSIDIEISRGSWQMLTTFSRFEQVIMM